jgi:subtilisin family serine protease
MALLRQRGEQMAITSETVKLYVALSSNDRLWASYQRGDEGGVLKYILENLPQRPREFLGKTLEVSALPSGTPSAKTLQVRGLPSGTRSAGSKTKRRIKMDEPPKELIVALTADRSAVGAIQEVYDIIRSEKRSAVFTGAGADLPFAVAEHWCPGEASDPIFSDRKAAELLLGVPCLRKEGLSGRQVNVVIVDQGLDKARLGAAYADGWSVGTTMPGAPLKGPDHPHGGHGMMVARNVLSVAPEARLFDLPMLPSRIGKLPVFLSQAADAFRKMLGSIASFKASGMFPGPWILLNAWSVYDRSTEQPAGDYTNNRAHDFNVLIDTAASAGIDMVFAAGNCGQFCPSARCGPLDRGPGDSILGANSHPAVLTVGAVRSDMMWLGYSSQGPGQLGLKRAKPDLCAPSQFRENQDAHIVNTGTSTSAALAAGVVAALRGKWDSNRVTPQQLRDVLNRTARPGGGADRFGHGVLDAARAYDELSRP